MKHIFPVLLLLVFSQSYAQVGTISPYSRYGLGDISFNGFASQIGMGGVSAAFQDSTSINFANPASLGNLAFTVFEAAGRAETVNISSSSSNNWRNNASFSYLALAFPITKGKWGAGFGLVPFTERGYDLQSQSVEPNIGTVNYFFDGSGGLSRFYISNGFTIKKNLSVGLNASYVFGSLERTGRLEFPTQVNIWNTRYVENTSYGDFYFDYGLQYKMKISKNNKLILGFTGALKPEVSAEFDSYTYNYELRSDIEIVKDTVSRIDDLEGKVTLPQRYSVGAALSIGSNWRIIADYTWSNWTDFESFSGVDSLADSYRFSAGVLYRPTAIFGSSYWKRVDYKFGGHFGRSFLNLNNTEITDFGVSLGVGLPLRRSYYSKFQLAFEYGQRGTTDNNLIQENYFRMTVGVTMNDRWFVKRKFE